MEAQALAVGRRLSLEYTLEFDDINRFLADLLEISKVYFQQRLVAFYALGSLAHGGFSPSVSDIDVALILADPLSTNDSETIGQVCRELSRTPSPLNSKLSIFWSSPGELREPPPGEFGRFPAYDRLDLMEYGKILWGKDIRDDSINLPNQSLLDIEAVEFYCNRYDDGTGELMQEALAWRELTNTRKETETDASNIKELLPLIYINFIDAYIEPLKIIKQKKLARRLKKWRKELKRS